MSTPFRKKHLLKLTENWEETKLPLDRLMSNYFRAHKSIGSKDRKWISENIYFLFRNLGLIDSFLTKPISWSDRLELIDHELPKAKTTLEEHIQVSFPKILYERLKKRFATRTKEICDILISRAPLCLRANPLKITTQDLQASLPFESHIGELNPNSLYPKKPLNVFTLEQFKLGYFEVQDEGSSYIATQIDIHPGQIVCDFCAGSGGKTLAIAPKLQTKGQIYLYDIRPKALQEAKKRLHRAGIQNAQIIQNPKKFALLKGKIDHLILDVPCSGSGTYRRNPDLKWKFQEESFHALLTTQQEIFQKSFPLVKTGGYIHYITCSLFLEENEEQINFFAKHFPIQVEKTLLLEPKLGENDGFFLSTMKKLDA